MNKQMRKNNRKTQKEKQKKWYHGRKPGRKKEGKIIVKE
jgi:hypothetical protein